jgi:hypothetical protein
MTGKTANRFSPELRARAVRMVWDHAAARTSRSRRDNQRSRQDRGHPSPRTLAELRGRRVRDARMGGRVRQSPAVERSGTIPPAAAEKRSSAMLEEPALEA